MKDLVISFGAVIGLVVIAGLGTNIPGLTTVFGVVIPYLAFVIFISGMIWKVIYWSKSPVPFKIPSTCGQQKSLPWIKANKLDNPFSKRAVIGRMILEVVLFRSLFRNTKMSVKETAKGKRIIYKHEIFLWLFGLIFHYAFLLVFLRHMRFFVEPIPAWFALMEDVDSFFRIEVFTETLSIGLPGVFISGLALFVALGYLLLRRVFDQKVRYFSLASDYFPLFLLLGITYTGLQMRYLTKVDIAGVKELTLGFASFQPVVPEGIHSIFYIHLFLISVLFAYFPFSKLVHMGGVFFSPTRNLPGDNRMNRHVNPWNPEVKTHTYEEYEDDFRDVMVGAGLSVDKKE